MYTWRTLKDGRIATRDDNGPEFIISLQKGSPPALLVESVELKWGDVCRLYGNPLGIRDGWIQSHIQRESGGNPNARNPERKPGLEDDGVGLLQITSASLKHGFTDSELLAPHTNIYIGAKYIESLVKRYGDDFPKISAAFNAGSVRKPNPGFENPWGMHAWHGHIDSEVRALNYFIERALGVSTGPPHDLSGTDKQEALNQVENSNQQLANADFQEGRKREPT